MLELLYRALTSSTQQQTAFLKAQFPATTFVEAAQYRWVYSYHEQHGHLPSWQQLRQRFPQLPIQVNVKATLPQLVQQVRERLAFQAVSSVIDKARQFHEAGQPIGKVVAYLQTAVATLPSDIDDVPDVSLEAGTTLADYRNLRAKLRAGKFVTLTPWEGINNCIGLTEAGDFLVLAARPNLGKSWLAVALAEHFRRQGLRVLFASQEMSRQRIALRWDSLRFGLDYVKLSRGQLTAQQLARWVRLRKADQLTEQRNTLITGPVGVKGAGFGNILAKVATFKPQVLVVDGAYLIYPEQATHGDRERFALISSTLKRLSLTAQLRTIAIVQAKREAEPEVVAGATTASLAHIYGSDTWSQDADFVLILNGKRWAPTRTLTLEKAREGTQGTSTLTFQLSPFPTFREIASGGTGSDLGSVGNLVEVEVV